MILRGPYLADLLQQPAAVEATLAKLVAPPALPAFRRVILTGMGSSLAALHPLEIRLLAHGVDARIVDTSELLHALSPLLAADSLVVAVSQSGRSAEIVRLVERRACPIVAVTNTPGSPLAAGAAATILTHAGEESTVSCKTYVATLAALVFLGDLLCGGHETDALHDAPAQMKAYLDRYEAHVEELAVDGVRDVFFAGRGPSLAAAYTAGLIVKESTRVHAEGMTSAALRHGPMEMAGPHVLALVYEGDARVAPLNRALAVDLARAGARAHLVGPGAEGVFRLPAGYAPLFEILPAQMVSLALAAKAGIEAGRFVHATKVTSIE